MVFPAIGAIGALAGGVGSLIGATRASSAPSAPQQTGLDPALAALYTAKLAPGNTRLTAAAQELAAATGLYGGTETILSKILGQSAYDRFKLAAQKDQLSSNLAAAIPAQYASSAIESLSLQNKTNLAMQLLGAQNAADLMKLYATTQSQIQDRILQGETSLLSPAVQMSAAMNQDAAANRNVLAQNIATNNLNIRKAQQDTFNQLALQRSQIGGQSKLQREQFGGRLAEQEQATKGQLALSQQEIGGQRVLQREQFGGRLAEQAQATRGQLALSQQETESKSKLQREQFGGQLALSQQSYEAQSALDRQRFAQEVAKRQIGAGYTMAGVAAFA